MVQHMSNSRVPDDLACPTRSAMSLKVVMVLKNPHTGCVTRWCLSVLADVRPAKDGFNLGYKASIAFCIGDRRNHKLGNSFDLDLNGVRGPFNLYVCSPGCQK